MTDKTDKAAPDSTPADDLPIAISGPAVASALAVIARLLDEGAGKRPNNRRPELFPFTPQVLRNVSALLLKYADVAEQRKAPTVAMLIAAATAAATDQPAPMPNAYAGSAELFSQPPVVPEPDEPDLDEDDDWHHATASALDAVDPARLFVTPLQPDDTDIDEDVDGPQHVHAPVVLRPDEPAASGNYAPGTAGYAAQEAAAGSPNSSG